MTDRHRFESCKVNEKHYLYLYGELVGIYDNKNQMNKAKKQINECY